MRAPVEREPRRVRPPYEQRDDRLDHLRANPEAWRLATRLDMAALLEPLTGLDVGAYEHRILEWLAGMDTPTVAAVAALLARARAAGPLTPCDRMCDSSNHYPNDGYSVAEQTGLDQRRPPDPRAEQRPPKGSAELVGEDRFTGQSATVARARG